ncbi:hypothetical protein DDZ13_06170 [Coraliomargarita sinensis]|uniref:FecR protein domain-containing protein n=1 Tax=Coraliomargarita sinensis TaxID=2174842 RepID=A0A317ZIF7_9BACT|nr:hypothetical protein [Coraliomargarita sinensis]PXA04752.1 hypothetical protein DDZ13_06170 [Coraliomargarita sinensis]
MVPRSRILFVSCLIFSAAIRLAGEDYGYELNDGLAIITTTKGEVSITAGDGRKREAELHAVETLSGTEITTGTNDHIFLSLSNGSALGVYENTRVRFESYRQRPFPSEKQSTEHEPTFSRMTVQLTEGSLTFSAEHLSPLSQLVIQLPIGRIEANKASGRLIYNEEEAVITITGGIVSYYSPGSEEENFIHAPNQLRLNQEGAELKRMAKEPSESDSSATLTKLLIDATHHAKERVLFRVRPESGAAIPRPVLVADPEALLKESPRPYSYQN